MTKTDWLLLFLKILGLYLVVMHIGAFVTSVATLIIVLIQSGGGKGMPIYTWQTPLSAFIVILLGLVLVFKSRLIGQMIEQGDRR